MTHGGILPGFLGVQGAQGVLASPWGLACPRCPAEPQEVTGTARGTSGDTTGPLPSGTCPWHSPSQPQALVAQLDQPFLGNQGDPKGKRGVE